MKLTAAAIQLALWRRGRSNLAIAMPNYAVNGWWEADFYAVSKANLVTEYEIKLSVADFKRDAEKAKHVMQRIPGTRFDVRTWPMERKHDLLAMRSERGPNRFYFVVPVDLVDALTFPEWAGVICASPYGEGRCSLSETKKAPLLHGQKVSQQRIDGMRTTGYWRFWNLREQWTKAVNREIKRITAQ